MFKLSIILTLFYCLSAAAGWRVDCENYCAFSEFPNNCQGVYYQYPDNHKSYSGYSETYRGCYENRVPDAETIDFNAHVLNRSAIRCNCPAVSVSLPSETEPLRNETRTALTILREQMRARTTCAPSPNTRPDPANQVAVPYRYDEKAPCFQVNAPPRAYILDELCSPGLSFNFYGGCQYHGDAVGGMGWICHSGEMDRCRDIAEAQDPQTGAWYRNSYLRRFPGQYRGQPYFSRDMGNGVMKYLLKTRDKPRAEKWLRFLARNPKHAGTFNLCPPPVPQPPFMSDEEYGFVQFDDRCMMGPTFLGQLYRVLRHIGFSDGELNRINSELYQSMVAGTGLLNANLLVSARTVPAKGANAYQATLAADEVMSRMLMGDRGTTSRSAARILNERTSKINPRFHWLAQNATATEYGAYLIKKFCRVPKPNYGNWAFSGNQRPEDGNPTWHWLKGSNIDSVEYQYMGAPNSWGSRNAEIGHECIGWINLYLGNADRHAISCAPGESMIDGACRVVSFPQPLIAPIAGAGYFIDQSTRKILYGKVNYTECPWGGIPLPGRSFCELQFVIPDGTLHPTKTYWIENGTSLMGIFTAPNAIGECSPGETKIGTICRALRFPLPSPMLYPGISYQVSTVLGEQGVFYRQTNGRCDFGAEASAAGRCWIHRLRQNSLNQSLSYFVRRDPRHPGIYRTPDLIETRSQMNSRPESPRMSTQTGRPEVSH
jgi:hypothetical protein